MPEIIDFFFSPYLSAQTRRLQAAIEDGLAHVSRILPHDPLPNEPVTLLFSAQAQLPIEQVAVYYTTDGTPPSGEHGNATHGSTVLAEAGELTQDGESALAVRHWRATLPAQADGTLVRYCADGWNRHNPHAHWYADHADPISTPPPHGRLYAYHVDTWTPPTWWQDAIVYHIFVDRFNAAHDEPPLLTHDATPITAFFGGTLRGILEKLDYLTALGINCIWLSPLFESPTHHGYNASDYHTVAQRYGTNETLRELIQAAHQRHMRVMLDFVANHTSDEHPAFIAALHNPASETYDWYAFGHEFPLGYRSYAQVSNMPELLTDNPNVQRYLSETALDWLQDFGADALRLDYVPGPTHAFWTTFQDAIKTHVPQALTLGEITAPLPDITDYAGRVDAFMDFSLTQVLRQVFASRQQSLQDLLTFLTQRQHLLPATMARATLLDNHDMHRFLWLAEGEHARLALAATCHLTLDGTPIIYYGTEVGLSQYSDAHQENAYARPPMLWDEQQDTHLLTHYRRLLQLRLTYPALRSGQCIPVPVQIIQGTTATAAQVGAYLRIAEQQCLLIVLNNNHEATPVHIPLTALLMHHLPISNQYTFQHLLQSGSVAIIDGAITLELGGLDAAILALETHCEIP